MIPFLIMNSVKNAVVRLVKRIPSVITSAEKVRVRFAGAAEESDCVGVAPIGPLLRRLRDDGGVIGVEDAEIGVDGERLGERPMLLDDQPIDLPARQRLLPMRVQLQGIDGVLRQVLSIEVEA